MTVNVNALGINDGIDQFVIGRTVDPPGLLSNANVTQNITLDSIAIGDAIQVVAPYDAQEVIITAVPSGEGAANVNFWNTNAATINLTPGLFKFIITRA